MKTMTALAAMLLLHGCGSGPTNGNDATTTTANETPATAAPEEATPAVDPADPPGVSSTPMDASAGDIPGEEQARVEELAGNWRVVGVRVAPGPVQALSDDDPALMGAVLAISPERLAWQPHKGGFFTDTCPEPQIGPDGNIGCAEGQFGPPEAHLTSKGVRIQLDWYDGAILTLARNAGR
jgi:hypothetical protein